MMQDNYPNINDRKPLFPGGSCFPLSPDNSGAKNTSGMPYYPNDQLNVIFDVIGTPNEEDISFLTDLKAQSYLKSFLARPRTDLKLRYPAAKDEAIDLLHKILVFNPYFRPSMQECLDHPYFKQVRQLHLESKTPFEVQLEADKAQIINDNNDDADFQALRELFVQESLHFKELRECGESYLQKLISFQAAQSNSGE